jgi:hypothetical protein
MITDDGKKPAPAAESWKGGEDAKSPESEKLRPPGGPNGNSNGGSWGSPSNGSTGRIYMLSDEIPAAPGVYRPDHIVLYGIKLNKNSLNALLPFDEKLLSLQVLKLTGDPIRPKSVAIIVAYGYSFDGKCYRFSRPKMLAFDKFTETVNAKGCGFEEGYSMWSISSQQVILELGANADLAETLILDANLPGNRAPNTYSDHMQLAHRNGRLGRTGG